MGSAGHDAVWSMGDDTPIPPLARIPPGLYAYLRQRFAQVTNPAIDPLRETLVMSLRMHIGRRGSLLADRPAGLRLVRNEHPVLLAAEIAALRTGAGAQVTTLDATWSASAGVGGGPDALRTALDGLCRSAGNAVREGARIVILSDRAAGRERAPLPMLLAVGAVHQHLLEHGLRTRLGLIAEAGDAWDVHHFAALIGYGAEAVHPWLALESVPVQVAEDDASLRFRAAAEACVTRAVLAGNRCPRLRADGGRVAREKKRAFRAEEYWGRPVPGFGDRKARLLIVGLAPAAHGANRTGRMFTGDSSGDWLYEALHRFGFASRPSAVSRNDGLRLTGCYITAAARCAPPGNKPTRAELQRCRPYLEAELRLLTGIKVVIVLGRIAHDAWLKAAGWWGKLPARQRPRFAHGAATQLPDGIT